MTELELYKFIEESGSYTSFDGDKAIMWIYHFNVDDFVKLIGQHILSEGGIEVRLQEDCIAVDMSEICEYHNIELENVFEKN